MGFSVETERLILRDLREDDTRIVLGQFAEPAAREYILSYQPGEPYVRAYVQGSVTSAGQQPRHFYGLAIVLKGSDEVVGTCSLSGALPESIEASVGWHLGGRFRGLGYATEAAGALLRLGFETCEVSRIYADCFAHNRAAARVMEKVGMTRHRSGALLSWVRAVKYRERKPIIRYQIWRGQWPAQDRGGWIG
jgi:ribosomal-protein-alanine N-acetyltransferase